MIFRSTYICKQIFLLVNDRKNKYGSQLSDEHLNAILKISTINMKANKKADIKKCLKIFKSHL